MGFGQAISHNLSNMTNFSGRAGRPEFWWWVLAIWLLNLVVSLFTGGLTGSDNGFLWFVGWVISIILTLATIAVGARRLHDTGKSRLAAAALADPLRRLDHHDHLLGPARNPGRQPVRPRPGVAALPTA